MPSLVRPPGTLRRSGRIDRDILRRRHHTLNLRSHRHGGTAKGKGRATPTPIRGAPQERPIHTGSPAPPRRNRASSTDAQLLHPLLLVRQVAVVVVATGLAGPALPARSSTESWVTVTTFPSVSYTHLTLPTIYS